jgi:malic enzyme
MSDDDPRIAKANQPAAEALRLHALYRGKVQILPMCPIRGPADFAIWYTPGVAAVRARTITDEMALAAAAELAAGAAEGGLSEQRIVPRMDEWSIYPRVAVAAALAAQRQGVARLRLPADALRASANKTIAAARDATSLLIRERLIGP